VRKTRLVKSRRLMPSLRLGYRVGRAVRLVGFAVGDEALGYGVVAVELACGLGDV